MMTWHHAIIRTNADMLSIVPSGIIVTEIWLKTKQFPLIDILMPIELRM